MNPNGHDNTQVTLSSPNQADSIVTLKKCNAIKNKYLYGFKQMSNREYHEFRTQCGYITKEKRYLTVFNNIDSVKTSNCDGNLYSDIQ